jgi:hypothetical protein
MIRSGRHGFLILMVTGLIILIAAVHHSQSRLDRSREIRFINRLPVFLPNAKILKALSMGHPGTLADYFWIQCVLYMGRRAMNAENVYYLYEMYKGDVKQISAVLEHHQKYHGQGQDYQSHSHGHQDEMHHQLSKQFLARLDSLRESAPQPPDSVPFLDHSFTQKLFQFESRGLMNDLVPLIDRVTFLDPHFQNAYLFSVYMLAETGEIDETLRILERGYRENPDNWRFPYYLGYVNWIYKGDLSKASGYLIQALPLEGCPGFVGQLILGFSGKSDRHEITKLYLEGLLESTENEEVRERLQDLLSQMDEDQH